METETIKAGTEPIADDADRRCLLWLMAEYFKTLGFSDLKARLPGYVPPVVLCGTLEDHRPDLTCRQTNKGRTPVILECVTITLLGDPNIEHRWTLLASAAKLYGAELHFVVPKWSAIGACDQVLKKRLSNMEIGSHRVWVV